MQNSNSSTELPDFATLYLIDATCGLPIGLGWAIRSGAAAIRGLLDNGDMPAGATVKSAIEDLRRALGDLDRAIDLRFERERDSAELEDEVRRTHTDRSRLAQELDQSEFRANRLEEVNREVSRRLVTAMETIRAVLDR
jgi:hypothetical protein